MKKETTIHASSILGINFSGKYRDAIFGNNMIPYKNSGDHSEYDSVQNYIINHSGYRSPEFKSNVDLLFAGCSFTYGMGIPESGIWGSLIANKKQLEYNNLSQNGASIQWIVRQLFAYFKEYGNPKILLCLFPNPTRMFFSSDSSILTSDDEHIEESTVNSDGTKSVYNTELSWIEPTKKRPKNSNKPHKLEDVVNIDIAIQISMESIRMLEQYCRSSNIEFLWGTWSQGFASAIEESGGLKDIYDFACYVETEYNLWKIGDSDGKDIFYPTQNGCHLDMVDSFSDSFYCGTDTINGHPHCGVHRQIHFAESFMRRMK